VRGVRRQPDPRPGGPAQAAGQEPGGGGAEQGATVALLGRKDLLDIYVVRAELEGFSCELAAARVTDRCITELDAAQGELEEAVSLLDPAAADDAVAAGTGLRMKHANDWFHTAIHQAAGNAPLLQLIKDLGDRCPKDYISRALRVSPEVRALNVDEHRRIRAALGAGDGLAARLAMRDHIMHARTVIAAYLDEQGFWGER
jgi:DNA-binding GntR family transcriptional regulator